MNAHAPARRAKFRQAAFFYLHVAILYEAVVWVLHTQGRLPAERGPVAVWLLLGLGIAAAVFWGLWWWQNVWVARVVWFLGAFRIPGLLEGALRAPDAADLPPTAYLGALVVVLVNLWLLARAGWDL